MESHPSSHTYQSYGCLLLSYKFYELWHCSCVMISTNPIIPLDITIWQQTSMTKVIFRDENCRTTFFQKMVALFPRHCLKLLEAFIWVFWHIFKHSFFLNLYFRNIKMSQSQTYLYNTNKSKWKNIHFSQPGLWFRSAMLLMACFDLSLTKETKKTSLSSLFGLTEKQQTDHIDLFWNVRQHILISKASWK